MREAQRERRDETCWRKKCIRGWSEARKLKVRVREVVVECQEAAR
jgi:hypothetical protein